MGRNRSGDDGVVEEDGAELKSVAVLDGEGARQIVNLKVPLMLSGGRQLTTRAR